MIHRLTGHPNILHQVSGMRVICNLQKSEVSTGLTLSFRIYSDHSLSVKIRSPSLRAFVTVITSITSIINSTVENG